MRQWTRQDSTAKTGQFVITKKPSQAKDVRAAVGSRYGAVLAAEGRLLDLCEPEDVNPDWKRWSAVLLRPGGLYGTRPAAGGNKPAKLKAIRTALRTADRVWLATDYSVRFARPTVANRRHAASRLRVVTDRHSC